MDYRLELVVMPVSDVDRAKTFYTERVGFNLDVDTSPAEGFLVVQLTPPGSACSITIGTGLTDSPPGSYKGLHLIVNDIVAAREELVEHQDYASFADFPDPDGNVWVLQEVPSR